MSVALVSYDTTQGRSTRWYPPVHLANLATSVEHAGFEVRVFDYSGKFAAIEDFFRSIRDYQPVVVGLTCYTPYISTFYKNHKATPKLPPADCDDHRRQPSDSVAGVDLDEDAAF
jgi:hypothetical protein